MKPIISLIVLSALIFSAMSQTSGTFGSTTQAHSSSAVLLTNGYVVTLNGSGWIYGNPVSLSNSTPSITWTTLTQSSGVTGIGLVGATCATPYTTITNPTDTFVGDAARSCPADFATLYTGTPPAGTTSAVSLAVSPLVVNGPVSWTLSQPATAPGNVIGITVNNNNGGPIVVSTPTIAGTNGSAPQFATATLGYAFYVQTTGSAVVCFQTPAQFAITPRNCGAPIPPPPIAPVIQRVSSASILSATLITFAAAIALIFFK